MSELREVLERLADESGRRGSADVLAGAAAQAVRLRRRRRLARAGLAIVAVAAVVGGLVLVARPNHNRVSVSGTQPKPRTPREQIVLPPGPGPLVAAAVGHIWIAETGVGDSPGHLLDIDPNSGAVEVDTALAGNAPFAV